MSRRFLLAALCAAATTTTASADDSGGHWTEGVDDADSSAVIHTLSQVSVDSIPDEYAAKDVQPELQFRCSGGDLTFRIDWGRFISSFNTEVGFRVDGGGATWLKLGVDASNKLTVAKAADTAKLIDKLGDGSVLNVEVAPYSEPSVFVSFNVSTLADALQTLEADCN